MPELLELNRRRYTTRLQLLPPTRSIPNIGLSVPVLRGFRVTAKPLRVGLIGLGAQGRTHISCLLQLDQGLARIVGLCDLSATTLATAGEHVPDARTETDYRRLLDSVALDLVIISTMPHSHEEICYAAFEHGIHASACADRLWQDRHAAAVPRPRRSGQPTAVGRAPPPRRLGWRGACGKHAAQSRSSHVDQRLAVPSFGMRYHAHPVSGEAG